MGSITIGTRTVTGINLGTGIDVGTKTTSIGTNGTYDVDVFGYASNEITVSVPSSSVGTVTISTNGTYDVSGYASAVVSVSTALPDGDFLCFTAKMDDSTVGITKAANIPNLKFYKSTDKVNWTEWDGTAVTLAKDGDKLYVYGDNVYISQGTANGDYTTFNMYGFIDASGDIMTLLSRDGKRGLTPYAFYRLFQNCDCLASAPSLPAKTLAKYCYGNMFDGCISLCIEQTPAPALPATTLAPYCYYFMFQNCIYVQAPALPATTLAEYCYYGMFRGCASLATAPALPATTLAQSCYNSMFSGCTSMAAAPSLPATTLASSCYQYMFQNCTALTSAPALPATTLTSSCYSNMFNGCTALTTGVDLRHVTTDATTCCVSMYNGCTSLNVAYAPSVATWTTTIYTNWLLNVAATGTLYQHHGAVIPVGTNGVPSGWTYVIQSKTVTLSAIGTGNEPILYSFNGTIGTVTVGTSQEMYITSGDTLNITVSGDNGVLENGCVTTVGTTKEIDFNNAVTGAVINVADTSGLDYLTFTAGEANSTVGMTHTGTNATTTMPLIYVSTDKINWTKWDGTAVTLANVGDKLYVNGGNPSGVSRSGSNKSIFTMTGSIAASGDATTIIDARGVDTITTTNALAYLFQNCTALTSAPALTATTLATNSCYYMFSGCTSLTTGVDLRHITAVTATTFSYMYDGCTSLNVAYTPSISSWANSYFTNWLRNVAATGTLYKPSNLTPTANNNSGCPSGWTTEPYTKSVTFSAIGTDNVGFSYAVGTNIGSVSVGTSVTETVNAVDSVNVTTIGTDYHLFLNGTDEGDGPNYSYNYGSITDGDVYSSQYVAQIPYLCFTANTANSTVGMSHNGTNSSTTKPVIYVSTDKTNWSQWNFSTITLANQGDKVYMYGSNPNGVGRGILDYSNFVLTGSIAASGNVTMLIDANTVATVPNYGLSWLFYECTALTSVPNMDTVTRIGYYSCYGMFGGCTGITEGVNLQGVTDVTNYGCQLMYSNCSGLQTIYAPCIDDWSTTFFDQWVSGVYQSGVRGTFWKPWWITSIPTGNSGKPSLWYTSDYVAEHKTVTLENNGSIGLTFRCPHNGGYGSTVLPEQDSATLRIDASNSLVVCGNQNPVEIYQNDVYIATIADFVDYTFAYSDLNEGDTIRVEETAITVNIDVEQGCEDVHYQIDYDNPVQLQDGIITQVSVPASFNWLNVSYDGAAGACYKFSNNGNEIVGCIGVTSFDITQDDTITVTNAYFDGMVDAFGCDVTYDFQSPTNPQSGTISDGNSEIFDVYTCDTLELSVSDPEYHLIYGSTGYDLGTQCTLTYQDLEDGWNVYVYYVGS